MWKVVSRMENILASSLLYLLSFSWGWGLISFSLAIIFKQRFNTDTETITKFWNSMNFPSRLWYVWSTEDEFDKDPVKEIAAGRGVISVLMTLFLGCLILSVTLFFWSYFFVTSITEFNDNAIVVFACIAVMLLSIAIVTMDYRHLRILQSTKD